MIGGGGISRGLMDGLYRYGMTGFSLILQAGISLYWFWTYPSADEGLHMYNAYRVSLGEWPYLDFFSYITPGTYLIGGGILSLAAGKVVYLRVFMLSLALIEILLMSQVIRVVVGQGGLHALWLAVYVSVTALSATYFSHHNVDHFFFVVMLYIVATRQVSTASYAWLGVLVAADSFVHQAHGFYYFIAVGIYLLTPLSAGQSGRFRYFCAFALPSCILYVLFCWWLVASGSLRTFIDDAIIWVVTIYGKDLAFGIFEDTWFYIGNKTNLVEQGFFLFAKAGVLVGCGTVLCSLFLPKWRKSLQGSQLQIVLLFLAASLGSLQTLHNPAAYFIIFFVAMSVYIVINRPSWILYVLLLCTCVQIIRVASFPMRHAQEYDFTRRPLVRLEQNFLIEGSEVSSLIELVKGLKQNGVQRAVVVGRSPEIYLLTGIKNPTRHDVILPVYLSGAQLAPIVEQVKSEVVIYDRTLQRLERAQDFFDVHHYKAKSGQLAQMAEVELFRQLRLKPLLFETPAFQVYAAGIHLPAL